MRRLLLVLGVAAGLVTPSCDGSDAGGPDPTIPPRATTTTTVVDVSVIPPEITVAYLDAVIDRLDVIVGDAFRELVRDRGPNKRFLELLDAVYDGQEFEDQQSIYGEIAADEFENVRPEPGNPVTTIERIVRHDAACVITAADRTFAAFFSDPHEPRQAYLTFAPRQPSSDPARLNPTAWVLVFDAGTLDDVEPTSC